MGERSTPPPVSETGVEMTGRVGVGWLRGTIRGVEPEDVTRTLAPWLGPSFPRGGGTRWYRSSAVLDDRRAMVAWDGQGNAAGTVLVELTQQAFDRLGWDRSRAVVDALRALGLRPSRLDLWADDREGLADPQDVLAALEAGQTVTHAQGHEWRSNSAGGATAYVGSRESERFLRVYRTLPVHGYVGTRWELESKGDAARDAMARLLRDPSAPGATAALVVPELIVAFVDFRDRAGIAHGDRAPRLAWWARLVGSMARVRGAAAVRIDGAAKRAAWVVRQVGPTLAALWASPRYGNGWLNEVLSEGLGRLGGGEPAWART